MVLERIELNIGLQIVSRVHEWVHQTLRTVTSPMFNELVIWTPRLMYPWGLPYSMRVDEVGCWKAVDESLSVLAGRNPDFRVVFRGDFGGGLRRNPPAR